MLLGNSGILEGSGTGCCCCCCCAFYEQVCDPMPSKEAYGDLFQTSTEAVSN